MISGFNRVVFLPCRAGSERVPNKNTRPFAGYKFGLLELKLNQLEKCTLIDAIVLDSNDKNVIEYGNKRKNEWGNEKTQLIVQERPNKFGKSSTTTDELIIYCLNQIHCEMLIWTHVTSPFFTTEYYHKSIRLFDEKLKDGFDSLMSVTKIQNFLWSQDEPINYDRSELRWPRTQDISPIYEVNSAIFISKYNAAENLKDRIGKRPFLMEMPEKITMDIDWEEEFELAEKLHDITK